MNSAWINRAWTRQGFIGKALWVLLVPASAIFSVFVSFRNVWFSLRWRRALALGRPAISIGNLTVGGTGKTPSCIWLARGLQQHGLKVAILTRGYGGKRSAPLVLFGSGNSAGGLASSTPIHRTARRARTPLVRLMPCTTSWLPTVEAASRRRTSGPAAVEDVAGGQHEDLPARGERARGQLAQEHDREEDPRTRWSGRAPLRPEASPWSWSGRGRRYASRHPPEDPQEDAERGEGARFGEGSHRWSLR